MPFCDGKQKMLGLEKYKKSTVAIVTIIGTIGLVFLGVACCHASLYGEKMTIASDSVIIFTFSILPFLLIGGLYGYLISSIVFSIAFVCSLVYNMDNAYKMAIYLVPMLCFSFFGQYLWFRTVKKTILSAFFTLVLTALVELLCISLVAQNSYAPGQLMNLWKYLLREVIVIFGTAFLFYLYYSKTRDFWKYPFPVGVAYTGYYQEEEVRKQLRKTKVSYKITAIIIAVEVLLGIFVAFFMVALFPDIKEMFAQGMNRAPILSSDEAKNMAQHIENMKFTLDATAISYDLKMLLLMLCSGVPMAGIANFYTKTAIGAPLGNMSDFMREYAESDDKKKIEVGRRIEEIPVKSHDEIRVMYESIKATVYAIENYITRINEEYEIEKELEVAREASEAKSAFLSNMSHEIRTPINAVLGLNEMIIRESEDPQIVEYANSVKSAGNSLLGIVNDILDFSKIEAGKMDILPVEYHLSSTINDLVNLIAVRAEDKHLELKFNIDKTLPTQLIGDEIRIKQCVTNILTNAVKYTEKGSVSLNISYRKDGEDSIYLRFQVIDTGIGIKEEDLEKLYSPFERIEETRNRSIEGTGLGMSIVKKLLALMGSRLEVKSVYGEGSDFSFEVKQQVASWEELGDFRKRYREYLGNVQKYHESFVAPDAHILVVDDTPINLTVVKGLLKATRIHVDTAESGMETLKLVRKKKYDVIFIDHRMPEMDGIQTLEALKKMKDNLSIDAPLIALTANAGAGAREEYVAAGFNDYLSKPVNSEALESMLKEYLPKDKVLESNSTYEENESAGKAAKYNVSEFSGDDDQVGNNTGIIDTEDNSDIYGVLYRLQGIDLTEAEKNCGSLETLKEVVKEFLTTIDTKADSIEKFASEKDYRNYTILVHALKSSARLIGATELSQMAAYLEECGNNEDEEQIREKTPQLLELFRSYNEKLSAIVPDTSEDDLPEIEEKELKNAFRDMRELLEAYDFDTADGIMDMLAGYRIPDSYKDKFDEVKKLMSAVDRDALIVLLEE